MKKTIFVFMCVLLVYGDLYAQTDTEPTLEETLDFIKMKSINKLLWYTDIEEFSSEDAWMYECRHYNNFWKIERLDLVRNIFALNTLECMDNETSWYLQGIVRLSSIKTIELINEGKSIKFTGIDPIMVVKKTVHRPKESSYDLTVDRPTIITIYYGVDDAPRLLKAYKHLFKLLNIKLIEEKF